MQRNGSRHTPVITTIPEAKAACAEFASALGFPYFMLSVTLRPARGTPPVAAMLTNYPREWVELYQAKEYLSFDPIVEELRQRVEPICWKDIEVAAIDSGESAVAQLFDDARRHGVDQGLSVPVHGPNGELASFSLCGREPPGAGQQRDELYKVTWLFAARIFASLRQLVLTHRPQAEIKRLSKRMRQVLSLTAQGKSLKAIAATLNINIRTVQATLSAALSRLGVPTREQAIVLATQSGQIELVSFADTEIPDELIDG